MQIEDIKDGDIFTDGIFTFKMHNYQIWRVTTYSWKAMYKVSYSCFIGQDLELLTKEVDNENQN